MKKEPNVFAGGSPYFDEMTGKVKIPKLTRLSPGVYRNPLGGLVNSRNRAIRPGSKRATGALGSGDWLGQKPPVEGRGPTTPNWLGGGRALSPEERSRAGIDPMDPNLYWQGDNGNIIGTLMGWYRNQGEAQKPLAPKPDGMMNDTLINLLKNMRG